MFIAWAVSAFQNKTADDDDEEYVEFPIDVRLEQKFHSASARLVELRFQLDKKILLKFYGLYKQATSGPADPKDGPHWYETEARVKFNEWLGHRKMNRAIAMEKYCELLQEIDDQWNPDVEGPKQTWNKVPSTMETIEPEMFDDVVVKTPTRLETEEEKEWFAAMRGNNIQAMQKLLDANPDIIEAKDQHLGMTALLWSTDLGCERSFMWLLDEGANVHAVDECLQTPLHFAAQCSRPFFAELLLQAGANVNALDSDGLIPAECCVDEELKQKLTPCLD
ncbi:unnamed protein product [Caenorhabditis nigoni]|uniref:Acyl-CoA-binding domain-containing protein 6 n=1 Tax=Caenorhabditis nigoni TaxID=1611254 RepID=A0A2G5UT81_9PELO|nr:hypothetical protein B9Z55_009719 [Caenorhabditis nigoni]